MRKNPKNMIPKLAFVLAVKSSFKSDNNPTISAINLTNNSRDYLREWLPWLDNTTKLEDTKEFIKMSLKGFAENKSMNTVIIYK
ncbi:hypothetical protein ACFWDG_14925 [Peribacillus sp. NPDC060186]